MSKLRLMLRRFAATFTIFCLALYLCFVAADGWEFWQKAQKHELQASVADYQQQMQEQVRHQSEALKNVDAINLGRVYLNTLNDTDCSWLFVCHPRVFGPDDWFTVRGIPIAHKIDPPFSGMMIPSGRTVRGTPHALRVTAVAIAQAGAWAVLMFLACTVIWLALVFLVLASDTGSNSYAPWMMLMGSPLFIPLLVWCVQWVAVAAMDRLGWAVALAAHVAAYSSALAVLVGARHVWRTPMVSRGGRGVSKTFLAISERMIARKRMHITVWLGQGCWRHASGFGRVPQRFAPQGDRVSGGSERRRR